MSFLQVRRPLPKPLERLAELAFDLRLIGSKTMSQIWRRLDADAWSRCNNPYMILQNAHQEVLDEAAADEILIGELQRWLERQDQYMQSPGWFGMEHAQSELRGIAYFSMEFGLAEALPIYSGGLGILAGDHLKSASDLNVPRGRHRPALSTRLLPPGAGRGRLAVGGVSLQRPGQPADHAGPRRGWSLAARATGIAWANALPAGLERSRGKGEPVPAGQQSPARTALGTAASRPTSTRPGRRSVCSRNWCWASAVGGCWRNWGSTSRSAT